MNNKLLCLITSIILLCGCQSNECKTIPFFDLQYKDVLNIEANASCFDYVHSSAVMAYKWIYQPEELALYLENTKFSLGEDAAAIDHLDFEQYNLLAIVYWEGCENAKHYVELCDNNIVQFSHDNVQYCLESVIYRTRLIQLPKGDYRIQF